VEDVQLTQHQTCEYQGQRIWEFELTSNQRHNQSEDDQKYDDAYLANGSPCGLYHMYGLPFRSLTVTFPPVEMGGWKPARHWTCHCHADYRAGLQRCQGGSGGLQSASSRQDIIDKHDMLSGDMPRLPAGYKGVQHILTPLLPGQPNLRPGSALPN
jgi:hypothetical protein